MRGSVAWRISGIYAGIGEAWIFLSSAMVWIQVGEPPTLAAFLELAKGSVFILVTAVMLFVLLRRWEGEIRRRDEDLVRRNRDIAELNGRLSGIMRCSQDLIAAWDKQKRLIAINPRYVEVCLTYFGQIAEPGTAIETLFGAVPEKLSYFSTCWDRTLMGDSFVELQHLDGPDGGGWFETSYGCLTGTKGEVIGGFHIVRDVTEHHTMNQERHAHAERLARAVETLTIANSELERLAYVASHDLQEPLRTITAFTQLIGRDYGPLLDAKGRDYLGLVTSSAIRMHELIRDLLAYSRMTAISEPRHPIQAEVICRDAIANLHEAIATTGAEIAVSPLPEVQADGIQLMQVFQNLIGNALKFRRPDILPRIEIAARRHGPDWQFTVRDNGIGFDPAEQDVFELFRRLRPHEGYPGTGVGLAISKRIIQQHGGRIWVDSSPEAGSAFHFTLPPASR